jgi:ABC-type transport system substrate-binding protein
MTAPPEPVGTVHVIDPSPLNWLFITWNTMEEPIRIDEGGRVVYALAESSEWLDDRTLELRLRRDVRFQDGEHFTAHNVKQNFDEMQRWAAPHPPGTWLNFPAPESTAEVVDDHTVRFHLPGPDGLGHRQVPRLPRRQLGLLERQGRARLRLQEVRLR